MEELAVVIAISDPGLNARVVRALSNLPVRVIQRSPQSLIGDGALLDHETRRTGFDVVFLELAAIGERALDLIQTMKSRSASPAIVTVHPTADTESLLAAFRAGADDCLYLPLEDAALREVFDRVVAQRERLRPQPPLAKTVGVISATGGSGGTMLACHFASEVSRSSSQNTLLADFDLTAGMVGFWMHSASEYSIWDVVRAWHRLDLSMWRGLVSGVQPHLDVLAAPSDVVADEACDPEQLYSVLHFARSQYDWVVADLGSGLTAPALRLLGQLNSLILVSTSELPVLYQSKRILRKLVGLGFPRRRVRLVLNCVRRRQLHADEVAEALGWEVVADLPHAAAEIEEAQADGKLLSRRSDLGKRIAQFTAKFMSERLEEAEGFQVRLPGAPQPVTALSRAWQQSWR
jgi:pilus assembly protein CpaE